MAKQRQRNQQGKPRASGAKIQALLDSAIRAGLINEGATIQDVINFTTERSKGPTPFDYFIAWDGYFLVVRE